MANSNLESEKLDRNTLLTRFLISSNVDDKGVWRDGEDDNDAANAAAADDSDPDVDPNVAVGFDDDRDGADEVANTPAGNTAADDAAGDDPDADPDADVAAGFDDGESADVDDDAPAGNIAADDECGEDDGNGEGEINDKGDCNVDCNRAEC